MATHFVPKIRHQTIVIILRQKGFNSIGHFLLCNTYLHPMLLCSRQNAIQHESSVAQLHVYNSRRCRRCCCCCQIKLNHTAISLHPSTEWVNFSAIFLWPIPASFSIYLFIFILWYSALYANVRYKSFADDWIWTVDLSGLKRSLYQWSHNNCPFFLWPNDYIRNQTRATAFSL